MKTWTEVQKQLVFELNADNLLNMPASRCGPGVFKLYHNKDLIYIGWTDRDMRLEIGCHAEGLRNPCTMIATAYWNEKTAPDQAQERAQTLLKEFVREYCRLPRCNRES